MCYTAVQVNHLACAQLEVLLIPKLVQSAQKHNTTGVLSVITSLNARIASPLMPTPKKGQTLLHVIDTRPGYMQRLQYGFSKLVHLYFIRELSDFIHEQAKKHNISTDRLQIHAVDLGVVRGRGIATINLSARLFGLIFGRPAEIAARVVANSCAVNDDSNGALFLDHEKIPYVSSYLFNIESCCCGRC